MVKAGAEVDSYCTKCELSLAHTVHAVVEGKPAKVECNTCHAVHKFRLPPGAKPAKATKAAGKRATGRGAGEKKVTISFDELLRKRDLAAAAPYSPKGSYKMDQVIEHPTFGLGFVSSVRDSQKIEVTFRADVKVLIQGR